MHSVITQLQNDQAISREQSRDVFAAVVRGELTEEEITALLVGLNAQGNSADVIAGAVLAMLEVARPFPRPDYVFADVVGTGGDGANTINISTAVAFVAAAAGLPVAKHGNRAISSKCGAADLLESLGLQLELDPQAARRNLDESGFSFLFAPYYHAGIRHAMPVRKKLATRTIFNILGPLLNPARPAIMLVGVFHPSLCGVVAQALDQLGCHRALVVHGSGLDEIAVHGPTLAVELFDGRISERTLEPSDFGAPTYPISSIAGGTATENAQAISALLAGKGKDAHAAAVSVNAAALLRLSGISKSLAEGYEQARTVLSSGKGSMLLERCVALSRSAR